MNSPSPLVSIVINNCNYSRFLRDAINSALNQTYANREVIVVDDGSTDESREIIAGYGRRVIPVLKSNGGQASAINAGFSVSRGEIVCLLDSDDVWLPDKLQQTVSAALQNPSALLIYHQMQPTSRNLVPHLKKFPTRVFHGDIADRVRRSCGWWSCAPTSALCFRRAVLPMVSPIPEEEFKISADAFLTYLTPLLGPVAGIQSSLALYRHHGSNHFSNAARLGKRGTEELLQTTLLRYEELVSIVNERLGQLRWRERLNLEDHWSYQFQKYRLRIDGRLSLLQLTWRALRFPGDPAATNRLKMAANVFVRGRVPRSRPRI